MKRLVILICFFFALRVDAQSQAKAYADQAQASADRASQASVDAMDAQNDAQDTLDTDIFNSNFLGDNGEYDAQIQDDVNVLSHVTQDANEAQNAALSAQSWAYEAQTAANIDDAVSAQTAAYATSIDATAAAYADAEAQIDNDNEDDCGASGSCAPPPIQPPDGTDPNDPNYYKNLHFPPPGVYTPPDVPQSDSNSSSSSEGESDDWDYGDSPCYWG